MQSKLALLVFAVLLGSSLANADCVPGYFLCDGGLCIPDAQVCDTFCSCVSCNDEDVDMCQSASDSPKTSECSDGFFTCGSGLCIPDEFTCDGQCNCVGGCDDELADLCAASSMPEEPKEPGCIPGYFECDGGNCVPESFRCDGTCNCVACNDELDCSTTAPAHNGGDALLREENGQKTW